MKYEQIYPTTDFSDIDALMANARRNLEQLKRIDKAQPEGQILYRYFNVPYADGKVTFQVTELKGDKCVISACTGINLDEWDTKSYVVNTEQVKNLIQLRDKIEKQSEEKNLVESK